MARNHQDLSVLADEKIIDIDAVNAEIADLKVQIAAVEAEMDKYLEELGLK